MTYVFHWYMPNGDVLDDYAPGAYGSPEGAIIHGGVLATAFTRKTEEVFDAYEAIMHGRKISRGFRTTTRITASKEPHLNGQTQEVHRDDPRGA